MLYRYHIAVRGPFFLQVDLAGSERKDKAKTEGDRALEGALINKSLTTLGMVIRSLASGLNLILSLLIVSEFFILPFFYIIISLFLYLFLYHFLIFIRFLLSLFHTF